MKKLLFILTLVFTLGLTAQEIKISGVVTDESKATLPGTTIIVKGTQKGTTSDSDGKYTISAKTGDVLQFSYVGLETKNM